MAHHKFSIGTTVRLRPVSFGPSPPPGEFEILRHLPPESGDNQYRIKSADDGHERVIRESEIG
ncbi:MAG: hypothetical protein U1F33_14795 [Alphaproteobacteria bacterium]